MDFIYIGIIAVTILGHIVFAGFSTNQVHNEVFSRGERFRLYFLIWFFPFIGAHTANSMMNPKWSVSSQLTDREASVVGGSTNCGGIEGGGSE